MYEVAVGILVFLAIAVLTMGRYAADVRQEAIMSKSFNASFARTAKRKGFIDQLYADMQRYAQFMGKPALADQVYRVCFILPIVAAFVFTLLGWFILLFTIPILFFVPYFWMRSQHKRAHLKLKRQLREVRLLMAYLMKAGAPIDSAIVSTTKTIEYPLRPYLDDVCTAIGYGSQGELRVQTVVEAFQSLADRVKTPEMVQFSQLLAQGSKYDTPLSENLMQSVEIENKIRDANAEAIYGRAQSRVTMVMALFLGMPTFAFLIYAVAAYFIKMIGGTGMFGIAL